MNEQNHNAHVTSISGDVLRGVSRVVVTANVAMIAVVGAFVGWAAWAHVDEVTIGEGKVIPSSKIQVVQSLEGGIIREIGVREGALVEKGQLLVRIDPMSVGAKDEEQKQKIAGLSAKRARLLGEVNEREPLFDLALSQSHRQLVEHERRQFASRAQQMQGSLSALRHQIVQRRQQIAETNATIAALERTLSSVREELKIIMPLVVEGAVSRVDVIRLEGREAELAGQLETARLTLPRFGAAIAEAESQMQQEAARFRTEALEELNAVTVELATLRESNRAQVSKVQRTELRAPERGLVKHVHVTTRGQVVKPGVDIVEIVPLDDTLLIETKIRPQDVAFLYPGQPATVKITAYDYTLFGSLKGKLERISADAIETEKGETFYLAQVRTDMAQLESGGKTYPIIPGMVAAVDLLTGQKTVLQYLVKPFTRMRSEAFRER
ncbi:MAG: HlyD family type I secretion periplasmic adaptor subunit [Pseudomonadota bacterium]